jgi:hypothetical protein
MIRDLEISPSALQRDSIYEKTNPLFAQFSDSRLGFLRPSEHKFCTLSGCKTPVFSNEFISTLQHTILENGLMTVTQIGRNI